MVEYKPLDLSFLANRGSANPDSTQNIAQMLLANAGFSQLANSTLEEIAKANYAARHRVSGISRVIDLLSTGTYAIANAADKGIAAHQKDNSNSVLSDIGDVLKGAGKGFASGGEAGLRGAFGNDTEASNPANKTRMSDVINRLELHMSTAEAKDPANYEKVKAALAKAKINQLGGEEKSNLQYPNGVTDKDVENYFKRAGIVGIGADIVSDPFNFAKPIEGVRALKNLIMPAKESPAISDAVRAANNSRKFGETDRATGIPSQGYVKDIAGNLKGVKAAPPIAGPVTAPPVADLPQTTQQLGKLLRNNKVIEYGKGAKFNPGYLNRTLPRIASPAGLRIGQQNIRELASKILGHIDAKDPKWLYKSIAELDKMGGVENFARTKAFLESVARTAEKRGILPRQWMKQLVQDLPRRILEDSRIPAHSIVNDGMSTNIILNDLKLPAARLKPHQADNAFRVIRKYQSRVLGKVAPTTERIPGAMNRAIDEGRNARYSGPQQVNIFQTILHAYRHTASVKKFESATNILQHIENYFISKGALPHNTVKMSEGMTLPLSHVLRAIGPAAANMNRSLLTKILAGDPEAMASLTPVQLQRLENLKAGEAIATAPAVKTGIEHGKQIADLVAKAPISPARKMALFDGAVNSARDAAVAAGGGTAGANVAAKYMRDYYSIGGAVDNVYKAAKLDTIGTLAEAAKNDAKFTRVDPKTIKRLDAAIGKAIQSPPVRDLGKIIGPAARAVEWLGARFNAAYGNADFRRIMMRQQASAFSTAALRSKYIRALRTKYGSDPDVWNAAFKSAQGNLAPTGDQLVDDLATELQKTMESLFGGSGINEQAKAVATVAARTRLTMNNLNSVLKRFGLGEYAFTNSAKVKNAAGLTEDYSKGIDWLNSWQSWTVKNPYRFLHQIQAAVEYAARENIMFDEFTSRFGSFAKIDDVKYGVNHPRFKGVYFNAEGARQAETFLKIYKELNAPVSKGLQQMQHVLSKFKSAVTIYWPAHHVNNLIGDTFMNWYAGVNSLAPYTLAMKVMRSQHNQYLDIEGLGMLTSPNALKQAIEARNSAKFLSEKAKGNETLFLMRNGERVTNDMVATAARNQGILPNGRIIEDVGIGDDATTNVLDRIGLPGRFRGNGQAFAHHISETRDHFPRYAQFIDHLMKSPKGFEDSIEEAGNVVRKWHPDGLDTTRFEKNVVKTVLPFYSWMRKAIPLIIETALTSPGKIKAYPQLMEAIQIYNGITPEDDISQPFPTDQLFPDWLREKGIGPVMGGPGNYTVINPSVPGQDVLSSIFTPKKTIEGYLNPLIKVPIESLQGHEMMTNQGIGGPGNQTYLDYLLKQTPVVNNLGRMSGQFGVSSAGQKTPEYMNLLNLIGARMTPTGPYQKAAQFDLRDFLKSQRG